MAGQITVIGNSFALGPGGKGSNHSVAAVRFGCATAGISVTRPGTAASMPQRAEIEALRGGI